MNGLMMDDYPLTLAHLFDRAGTLFPSVEIVSRWPDGSVHRSTYGEFHKRVQQLANALRRLGLQDGERVATLAWNSGRHLEAYFAIPLAGGVLHTLNPRLSPQDLTFIMNHADDQILIVDDVLLPAFERFKNEVHPKHVIVLEHGTAAPAGTHSYEQLIAPEVASFAPRIADERQACGLCYTSGTTGRPRGVLYSHRSTVLHSMAAAFPDVIGLSMQDCMLPVVPMFHANAWGLPLTSAMVGAKQVFPGPRLDALSVLELLSNERVTLTAGVPTVWIAILEALDKEPKRWDLSRLRTLLVGGSAAPPAMIDGFLKRHSLKVLHAWGMTEMSPLGSTAQVKPSLAAQGEAQAMGARNSQGLQAPFVDIRAMGEDGPVAWDGKSMGELHVRGPWVAKSYFQNAAEADKFTMDGWFRTGDIVTIDHDGYIHITDRSKDVIKSGGEWISSVELENALMGHPAVKEAAVVAVKHPKWDERPVACVVLKDGAQASEDELREYLEPKFAKFWLPERFVYVQAIPRTAVGKFLKSELRNQLKDFKW